MKPVQSVKSVRSTKSLKSTLSVFDEDREPDLEKIVKMACEKYDCPFTVVIKKKRVDFYKSLKDPETPLKYKRINIAAKEATFSNSERDLQTESSTIFDENTITIKAVYNMMNRLTEIVLYKEKVVPRLLIQIIGVIIPYYAELTKISITECKVDIYTVYELSKMLPFSNITDICLDNSMLTEAKYAILIDKDSRLSNLSLRRCRINDEICTQIASKLHYSASGEARLSVLNLSSNHITDLGAKHIGEALRTNRHLRYLNLADNRITDEGASHIFNTLIEFPLTYDEILNKRRRFIEYLKAKRGVYSKYVSQFDSSSVDNFSMLSKKSMGRRKKDAASVKSKTCPKKAGDTSKLNYTTDEFIYTRAEMLALEMIGPFIDPFSPSCMKIMDGYSYCIGNMVLCYLNLSYNNLSYCSIKKLNATMLYQTVNKKPNQTGLIKVVLEGNYLPVACTEMSSIAELFGKKLIKPFSDVRARRKSKGVARTSILPERN